MNIAEIITSDCANGTGTRLSVFVSGCTIKCKGCFNKCAQDFNYGRPYNEEMKNLIINELKKVQYHGITILGGEPFERPNQEGIADLLKAIKTDFLNGGPHRDVWIYTGYLYEDLIKGGRRHFGKLTDSILDNTDVLVDGPFMEDKKDISLKFRGSSNQRIIDVYLTKAFWHIDESVKIKNLD